MDPRDAPTAAPPDDGHVGSGTCPEDVLQPESDWARTGSVSDRERPRFPPLDRDVPHAPAPRAPAIAVVVALLSVAIVWLIFAVYSP